MNRLVFALAVFWVAALSSCHAVRRSAPFDVAVRYVESTGDVQGVRLVDIRVEFEGFFHHFGSGGPRSGSARYSLFEGSWPEVATVRWRIDGDRPYMPDHEVTVVIPPRPELEGPDEEVTLWFDLDGKGVAVRLEKYDYGWIRDEYRMRKPKKSVPEN